VVRRGRPSLEGPLAVDSPRIAVRVPWRVHRAANARAATEGRTISEVVRELLAAYAAGGVSSVTAADRHEMRELLRMSDRDREAYYLASLRNVERLTT
jgi:hypothetical protein